MSTIVTQNFKDPTTLKTVDAAYVTDGTVKIWANTSYNSTIFNESFGMSSITDIGVGIFDLNFTNSMATSTYGYCTSGGTANANASPEYGSNTAAKTRLNAFLSNTGAAYDGNGMNVAILGDLA